ncbi:hypothetical protein HII31_11206 [Pseudocercospora fuligena]|uniref:Uncharacterized protein n=1 Tax=Pseudocercospora fuligena TaxID=685502 RepID=A0A8H6RAD3_9PEZI|nr:hypothetical protein HII31_11206 [Pseudocercospora fuligena]
MRAEASPPHEQHLSYPSDLDLLFFIHFALPNNDRGLPFPDITSLCTQDISTTNTQPGRLETQEVTTKSKMTSRNYNQASSKCNSSNMVDDLYADMPPLVTADGVTVVEQDDTSTPRTTLDTTAGIDFPEGPKKYFINMRAFNALSRSAGTPDAKPETKRLNAKSLAELSTSNIKVDIEEVSELSEDEEVLTPAASEFDAASIADTNAKDISDDLILDSVCAIDGGITEKRRVARQDLLKNQSVKGFNSTGDKMKKHKAESGIQNCENDAPIKAMAHKYASGHAFMNKVHNKVEHLQTLLKEKAELQASHDRVNESMNKRMEAMEQKRKGLHKKLAEVRAKHDKVVEENAAWMAKNKEREEAVQGKKKKVDLSFLPSEQWLNE